MCGPHAAYRVKHQLPHRIRIAFLEAISDEQLRSLVWLLEDQLPDTLIRPCSRGQGLVMCSRDPSQPLVKPLERLDRALGEPTAHLQESPPIPLVRLLRQSRQGSQKLLIALAIAGWALPILPGTPFFLLAWWLGWRPEERKERQDQSPEASNAIVNRGEINLAERHASSGQPSGNGNSKR